MTRAIRQLLHRCRTPSVGSMRENFPLLSNMMGSGFCHAIQQEIEKQIQRGELFHCGRSALSGEQARANFAAEEAERWDSGMLAPSIFCLGCCARKTRLPAVTLRRHGAHLAKFA